MFKSIIRHYNGVCCECKQQSLLFDETHGIVFCSKCGLVNNDTNQLPKIKKLFEDGQQQHLECRQCRQCGQCGQCGQCRQLRHKFVKKKRNQKRKAKT